MVLLFLKSKIFRLNDLYRFYGPILSYDEAQEAIRKLTYPMVYWEGNSVIPSGNGELKLLVSEL